MADDTVLADVPETEVVDTTPQPETPETATSEPPEDDKQDGEDGEGAIEQPETKEQKKELTEVEKIRYATQKRIDRLTARNAELAREVEALRVNPPQAAPATNQDEPQEDQFDTTEEYLIAKGEYKAKKAYEAQKQKEQEEANQRAYAEKVAKIRQSLEAKEAEFRKTKPDYDNAVAVVNEYIGTIPKDSMHLAVFRDFVMESENPAPVLYELGTNPDLIESMSNLTPLQFHEELVLMKHGLKNAPAKQVTKTAPPPTPLKGTISGVKDLNSMSYQEMKKAWKL